MTEPATLQAKYRIPLDERRANSLRTVLLEHPWHWLVVLEPFLEVHARESCHGDGEQHCCCDQAEDCDGRADQ